MEKIPEAEVLALAALAWVLSWVRAPNRIHNAWSWALAAVAAAALWYWVTPQALAAFQQDWRRAVVGVVLFALAGQGAARAVTDAKGAPPTNSL